MEHIKFPQDKSQQATTGSGFLNTQLPGRATTVSAAALASGGIRPGGLIETDN